MIHFPPLLLSVSLLVVELAVPAVQAEEMAELHYSGELSSRPRGKEPDVVKEFSLQVLASAKDQALTSLFWRVEENGTGWHWPESFGWSLSGLPDQREIRQPGLLYQYDRAPWPIPLPPLSVSPDQRKAGKAWTVDRYRYEVLSETKSFGDQTAIVVQVTTNFGRAQELLYHPETGLLLQADIKLFLGRGDEFALKLKRTARNELTASDGEKVQLAQAQLSDIQQQLERKPNAIRPEFSPAQIQVVRAVLPELDKLTENTPLQTLTIEIHRDLKSQLMRSNDLVQLAQQQIGQTAPKLQLTLLNGDSLPNEQLADQVIVLHFWKYHDDPLQEPYGQVGYLDYLNGKRGKLGVKFLGVAVDAQFANAEKSRTAMLNVKKLVSFMNLGYDVVRDDGTLLKKFGDPRESDGKLPLWVVIGADQKIRHYKVGFYNVTPREGLKELDTAIIQEIKARRARKAVNENSAENE